MNSEQLMTYVLDHNNTILDVTVEYARAMKNETILQYGWGCVNTVIDRRWSSHIKQKIAHNAKCLIEKGLIL